MIRRFARKKYPCSVALNSTGDQFFRVEYTTINGPFILYAPPKTPASKPNKYAGLLLLILIVFVTSNL